MRENDVKFLKEVERVRNVIQVYSFARNGVANHKVLVYSDMLTAALGATSQKRRKVLYNNLLTIK